MLYWLVDNASFLLVLLACCAVGFGLLYWNNRDRKSLLALGVTASLGLLIWLLTLLVVSDRQQIVRNLNAMAEAVLSNNPETLKKYLAPDFSYGGLGRDAVASAVPQQARNREIKGIRLAQFHFDKVERHERKASISFAAIVSDDVRSYPFQCQVELVHQDNAWLVQSALFLTPVGGQPIDIPLR